MLIAEIGEPPDIAEPHRVAQAGEEEVALVVPRPPLGLHRQLGVDLGHLLLAPPLAHGGQAVVLGDKTQIESLVCSSRLQKVSVWLGPRVHQPLVIPHYWVTTNSNNRSRVKG